MRFVFILCLIIIFSVGAIAQKRSGTKYSQDSWTDGSKGRQNGQYKDIPQKVAVFITDEFIEVVLGETKRVMIIKLTDYIGNNTFEYICNYKDKLYVIECTNNVESNSYDISIAGTEYNKEYVIIDNITNVEKIN